MPFIPCCAIHKRSTGAMIAPTHIVISAPSISGGRVYEGDYLCPTCADINETGVIVVGIARMVAA